MNYTKLQFVVLFQGIKIGLKELFVFFSEFSVTDETYWNSSPCSSDSIYTGRVCSPNATYTINAEIGKNQQQRIPFTTNHQPTNTVYKYSELNNQCGGENYGEFYYTTETATNEIAEPIPFVRVVKRRSTANKKERRRTQSINSAFAYLRDCIPNVPSDTKLSKVCRQKNQFYQ